MHAPQILEDQIILKKGRLNGLGFEPCFNAYFDFYLDSRYFEEPLLELADVTFHLFLRKNLNAQNRNWKMPSIRQIAKKFAISNRKIYPMLDRLAKAHLLNKESGLRTGSPNERNNYILSDPITTLAEFLTVAGEGLFRFPLNPEFVLDDGPCVQNENMSSEPCVQKENTDVRKMHTPDVGEMHTHKQTSSFKQTSEKQIVDPRWEAVLADFKMQMPQRTFDMFLGDTDLASIEDRVAVISTTNGYAKDWIEARLANKIKHALKVEGVRCVVLTD